MAAANSDADKMAEVLEALKQIQLSQTRLLSAVESMTQPSLASSLRPSPLVSPLVVGLDSPVVSGTPPLLPQDSAAEPSGSSSPPECQVRPHFADRPDVSRDLSATSMGPRLTSERTYPKQIGINPLPMHWAAADPRERGPIVVSRSPSTIRRRNAIGGRYLGGPNPASGTESLTLVSRSSRRVVLDLLRVGSS